MTLANRIVLLLSPSKLAICPFPINGRLLVLPMRCNIFGVRYMAVMGPLVRQTALTSVTERRLLVRLYSGLRLFGQNMVLKLLVPMSSSMIAEVNVDRVVELP